MFVRWVFWFAAVTGLAQTFLVFAMHLATGRLLHASRDIVWMAPLANAALFAVGALGMYFATRRMHRSTAVGATWAVFVILAGLGPALLVQKLHPAAAFLLLVGVAIQSGRFVRTRAERVDGFIRKSLPVLLVTGAVVALGQYGAREITARRAEGSLPQAAAGAPNVVLIVLDTVRASSLSLYGYGRATSPNLDQFARGGVTFEHALSTSSWTLPSHASMFTGRLPHEVSADWLTPLDDTHRTLAEALGAQGYATVGIVANLHYTTTSSGLDRGFQRYSDFPRTTGTVIGQSWLVRPLVDRVRDAMGDTAMLVRKPGGAVTGEFSDWLDSRQATRPFFAFLNYFDAHEPYQPPASFETKFGSGGPMPAISNRRRWNAQEIQRSQDAYDEAIAYVDHEVGRLIGDLRARQLLENTIVVITSDHGEHFGEHGLFSHGTGLYRPTLEVPLVLRFPSKIPAGPRITEPVSLVDLPATILGLTRLRAQRYGGQARSADPFPGRSLERLWTPSPAPTEPAPPVFSDISKGINLPPWQPVSKGRMRSVVLDGVHYILNGDGSEELYDFDRDVAEARNLIGQPDMAGKLAAARQSIKR